MTILADRSTSAPWSLRLLADVGEVIATSLEFDDRLRQVAALTIPHLADLCVFDLLADDGSIRDVAVAAADPSLPMRLEELRRRQPLERTGAHPVAQVLREGASRVLPEMDEALLRRIAAGDEHARLMLEAGYRSAIVVPLRARGNVFGVLSVLRMRERDPFGEEELSLVEEISRLVALALDNAVLYRLASNSEQRLKEMLGRLAEAVTVQDARGQLVYVNDAAARLLGGTAEQVLAAPPRMVFERFELFDERGRPVSASEMPGRRVLRGESPEPVITRSVVRATGQERWLVTKASALRDPQSGELFAVNVIGDITELKRSEIVQRFLNQAGEVLATSMDYQETLQRVANLAVPDIADWCAVDLLEEDGNSRSVAVAHADPAKLALAERLRECARDDLDPDRGIGRVLRTGEPYLSAEITDEMLREAATNEEHLWLLREAGLRSAVIVPMRVAGSVIGALTLVTGESARTFGEPDIPLAQTVADRAALAVEHARLYRNRAEIARTLQRELLPAPLPEVPGWRIAALYVPAGHESEVGGDLYEVFQAADTWLALIGDVTGKGIQAAGLTALVRHTSRTAAEYEPAPAHILDRVDRSLKREPGMAICSAICARLTERGATLAIGGHPFPLRARDGVVATVGEPGALLGAFRDAHWKQTDCELQPGETLLLYTDGVTETLGGDGERFGVERLEQLLAAHAALPPAELLERIEEELSAFSCGSRRDDTAILALQREGR
jgi:PAS domain S-box-containing protein